MTMHGHCCIFDDKQKFRLVNLFNNDEYTLISEFLPDYVLTNEGQTITVRKANNTDNQKWKILYETHASYITKGETNNTQDISPSSSKGIKINLTLNKNSLDQLLGLATNNDCDPANINMNSNFNKDEGHIDYSSCNLDNWLPRDAIRSICPGCDSNMFN